MYFPFVTSLEARRKQDTRCQKRLTKWIRFRSEILRAMNIFIGSTAFEPYTLTRITAELWCSTAEKWKMSCGGCESILCVWGERSASFKGALTSIYTQLAGVAVGSNPAVTFKVPPANWMDAGCVFAKECGGDEGRGGFWRRSPDMKLLSQEEGSGVGRLWWAVTLRLRWALVMSHPPWPCYWPSSTVCACACTYVCVCICAFGARSVCETSFKNEILDGAALEPPGVTH